LRLGPLPLDIGTTGQQGRPQADAQDARASTKLMDLEVYLEHWFLTYSAIYDRFLWTAAAHFSFCASKKLGLRTPLEDNLQSNSDLVVQESQHTYSLNEREHWAVVWGLRQYMALNNFSQILSSVAQCYFTNNDTKKSVLLKKHINYYYFLKMT